jgi:hypothetical protein
MGDGRKLGRAAWTPKLTWQHASGWRAGSCRIVPEPPEPPARAEARCWELERRWVV